MRKIILLTLSSLFLAFTLSGCWIFSDSARLGGIEITVDGDPAEWEPFPTVHVDPENDNISIEFDLSNIKAFTDNRTGKMYILMESYIPMQEFTSLEIDLEYGEDVYRLGLRYGDEFYGVLARMNAETSQWETITDALEYEMGIAEAVEVSFPTSAFPNPTQLKISRVSIMGGICCNQFEYYAIDYMN
jgi:hypothetical protein